MSSLLSRLSARLRCDAPAVGPADRAFRRQTMVAGLLAAPVYAGFALVNQVVHGASTMALLSAIASALVTASLIALRWRPDRDLAGHLFTSAIAVQVFGEMVFNGGLSAPAGALTLLVVPAAVFTIGGHGVKLWAMATALAMGVVVALDLNGLLPPNELPHDALEIDRAMSLLAGMAISAVVVRAFERRGDEAIARLRAERARFEHQALHDGLTGIPNRAHFYAHAQALLDDARAAGDRCAVFFFDIDDFKEINDRYGHEAGDRLLTAFAGRLASRVRAGDLAARLAGDEFAMVVRARHDTTIDALVARLRGITADPFDLDGVRRQVDVSVGHACYPDDGGDLDALLGAADASMYREKAAHHGSQAAS